MWAKKLLSHEVFLPLIYPKQNILNIFKKLQTDKPKIGITAIVARISRIIVWRSCPTKENFEGKETTDCYEEMNADLF
ncbi:hypothetical protein Trydic_g14214 [Trypoxylus dichotomus]